ncbi:MAG TPA: hypothetical protein VEJ63_21310 [Planctomycetota bacterium]|nr:hypothetical protein [Planctomycetota bacterium]
MDNYEIASLENAQPAQPPRDIVSIASAIAYIIIPKMAFSDCDKLVHLWTNGTNQEQSALYVLGCKARQLEPISDEVKLFQFHHGELDPQRDYYMMEFPPPEAFGSAPPPNEDSMTVGPYYSAVVRHRQSGELAYYILGQGANIDLGGTTFRCITTDGVNKNLGKGPMADFDGFLNRIREQISKESGEPVEAIMPASRVQRSTTGYGKQTQVRDNNFGKADVIVAVAVALSAGAVCYALDAWLFSFLKERTSGLSHALIVTLEAVGCVAAFFLCAYAAFKIRHRSAT